MEQKPGTMRSHIKTRNKKVLIVGAGMSGLTAGAYLTRWGCDVQIMEKSPGCGGLVNSFTRDGFLFDTGPRAIGNAGILRPLLEDLEIDLPCIRGEVSLGIRDRIVHFRNSGSVEDYLEILTGIFPDSRNEIRNLGKKIRFWSGTTRTLNKVANPYFKRIPGDPSYLFKELLPWLPSFAGVLLKTAGSNRPVEDLLEKISGNSSLRDIVTQHFFKGTPIPFALGYFESFLDYLYPLKGTGELPLSLVNFIESRGGVIRRETEVAAVDPLKKTVTDHKGQTTSYDALLWAADLKSLYRQIDPELFPPGRRRRIRKEQERILSSFPGESVFTIFLAVDEDPAYFSRISRGHFIYTPRTEGLGERHRSDLEQIKKNFSGVSKETLFRWARDLCALNSYEISIPVLKNSALAPPHQTGLIVSILFDGELFELVEKAGWYREFSEVVTCSMIDVLEQSIYPGMKKRILFRKTASPGTLNRMFNTSCGAITGWSLEKQPPVPSSLTGVGSSVRTSLPCICKAGQWSYSPAGVPIAILTGRIAAGALRRELHR